MSVPNTEKVESFIIIGLYSALGIIPFHIYEFAPEATSAAASP